MGFDPSFHPVDMNLVNERLLPYVRGEREIDDLVADAVRIAQVRFRANAWGLGAIDAASALGIPFEPHLYVWGRPFFVTADTPELVARTIDAYLAASPAEVDGIARESLARLDRRLLGAVRPDEGGTLPPREALARGFRAGLDALRACYAAVLRGEPAVTLPSGRSVVAADVLATNTAYVILEAMAELRPGWMARGEVWPSLLLFEAGAPSAHLEDHRPLLGDLPERLPRVAFQTGAGITSSYAAGGFASTDQVRPLRETLEASRRALLARDEGYALPLDKCIEALWYAELRGMAFVEATEIYSGIDGRLN